MKQLGIVLLLVLAMGAAGCSRTKVVPQNVASMAGSNFTVSTVTVKAGQAVKFINATGGSTHILVVGGNGAWTADPNAPTQLNSSSGQSITGGQEQDIIFPTAGTFTITCTVHPYMLLTVTVKP